MIIRDGQPGLVDHIANSHTADDYQRELYDNYSVQLKLWRCNGDESQRYTTP